MDFLSNVARGIFNLDKNPNRPETRMAFGRWISIDKYWHYSLLRSADIHTVECSWFQCFRLQPAELLIALTACDPYHSSMLSHAIWKLHKHDDLCVNYVAPAYWNVVLTRASQHRLRTMIHNPCWQQVPAYSIFLSKPQTMHMHFHSLSFCLLLMCLYQDSWKKKKKKEAKEKKMLSFCANNCVKIEKCNPHALEKMHFVRRVI